MPTEHHRVRYALSQIVPDIRNGCSIQTAKGELIFTGPDADALHKFVQDHYTKKASTLVQLDGCVHCED